MSLKQKRILSGPSIAIMCIVGACLVYLFHTSWFRWGELVIDTFRELLLPSQIMQGKILYKDLFYPYGLFPPYFLAGIYSLFGVYIPTLAACGMAITILMCVLLYNISRFFLDEARSILVVLTFLFVFAFGFYVSSGIFNFILPYSFASTFFMLFTCAALYFFIKFIFKEDERYLAAWSGFLCLAFFSRIDMTIPVWAAFILLGCILIVKNKKAYFPKVLIYLISPVVISAAGYILFLAKNEAFSGFQDSIINCIKSNATNALTFTWAGLDRPFFNSALALKSFAYHFLALSIIGMVSYYILLVFREKNRSNLNIAMNIVATICIFIFTRSWFESGIQYRCMPLVLLTGSILFTIKAVKGSCFKKDISYAAVFVVSLAVMIRIFFNATPHQYGFYMLSLSLVCYYVFFLHNFKDFFSRYARVDREIFPIVIFLFLALLIVPDWEKSYSMYAQKNLKVETDKGTFFCWRGNRSIAFWSAVEYMQKTTLKDSTVAVFPEGAGINFFSGRKTPLKYHTFLPPDIDTVGEYKILSELSHSGVDYIIVLSRDTTEYGYPAFGVDYARNIYTWIREKYELIKQFGPLPYTSNEFGIAIFKRRNR